MNLKTPTFLLVGVLSIFILTEQTSAQHPWRARGPLNRYHRFVGAFHSDGFHTATRGPSVGYYNPYSALNTSRFNTGSYGFQNNGFSYPTPVHRYQTQPPIHFAPQIAPAVPAFTPTPPQTPIRNLPPVNKTAPIQKTAPFQPKVPPQQSPSDDTATSRSDADQVRLKKANSTSYSKTLESVLQIN